MFEILFLIIGLIVGGAFSWFILKAKNQARINEMASRQNFTEEKEKYLEKRISEYELKLEEKEKLIQNLSMQKASLETEVKNLLQKLQDEKTELEEMHNKLKVDFKLLAGEILEEKTHKFTQKNKENLDEILNPLNEKLKSFESKVQETYIKGVKDQTDLKAELKKLYELNVRLDEDARNLTSALKSDTKKQGNWGEIILERVLERSGLVKGEEYSVQQSFKNSSGELIRPDVIINLPENKHLIIDSKVSLVAYESYANANTDEEKEKQLKLHLQSVRNHIKLLSEKNYQSADLIDTPDFVLLFMPIEGAFSLAIQSDNNLFTYAWDKKIVLVSPTTLLATLKTVASIWKHEKQTRNAIEIARQGGALYDKFVSFLEDLKKLGDQLSTVQKTYDNARKKLSDGTGNLIKRAEKMKKLGAKTSKNIPAELSGENEDEE